MSELSVRETAARALDESPALGCGCCTDPAEGTDFDVEPGWRQVALANAVLAAVADHDGLADVLRGHVHGWDDSDWHIDYGCRCGKRYSRRGLGWGQEPCHDEHAAHLADVVRTWLVQP